MASLTGYRKPTRWTVTIISAPQSARHDGSKRGNRRSVFLLTLDLRREMSGGSTQRLRLEREKGKKKKEAFRNEGWDTDTGKFLCPQPRGASGLHFPGRAAFVCARDQCMREADTENLNSPGEL